MHWRIPRISRRASWASGAALALLVGSVASCGPIVRSRVASEAERRNLDVDVGGVRVGWFALRLLDVRVKPRGIEQIHADLDEVRIELGAGLGINDVIARGGRVTLRGTSEELAQRVRDWRGARAESESENPRKKRVEIRIEAIAVDWRENDESAPIFVATGVSASRDENGGAVAFESARWKRNEIAVDLSVVSARVDPHGAIAGAKASSAAVSWEIATKKEAPASNGQMASDPSPPPLPMPVNHHDSRSATDPKGARDAKADLGKNGKDAKSDAADAPIPPLITLPDLHALRARVGVLGALAKERVVDGAEIEVDALSLQVHAGEERIAVGPGPLSVARHGDQVDVTFTTTPDAHGTPLSLTGQIPLAAGELVASLAGGPIPLSLLGASEGAAGLADVGRSTVAGRGRIVLAAPGDALTFDGEVSARGLALKHPKLAPDTIRGLDVTLLARGVMSDDGQLRLDDAEASMGALHLSAHGGIEQTADHFAATLGFDVPLANCQAMLDSVPSALLPTLRGARMTGTLRGKGRLAFDTRKLDDLLLSYDIEDQCKMAEVPEELAKERFAQPFTHVIYLPDGALSEEETGPTTEAWTEIGAISPFMQVAVLTTEDGAFLHHRGFNHGAIRNSLVANIKARKFLRGASTITMQLAKNLFLTREKTLSRKLEELILTDYLEQAFTKEEMMELYLNIIEFGPNVYGIGAAAAHYFGRKPAELNLAECLFLSSLLPSPVRYHKLFEKGQLPESWLKHVHALMGIAEKNGKISPAELAQGLAEPIVFYDPKLPPPPPRPAVSGSHFTGDDTSGWEELN